MAHQNPVIKCLSNCIENHFKFSCGEIQSLPNLEITKKQNKKRELGWREDITG